MNDYTHHLRSRGFRMTPQRMAILQVLHDAGGHLLPLQIVHAAQQRLPGMTEATVYRTLSFLAEQDLVMAAHIGSGQLVYEVSGHAHHHIICRECGSAREITHAALEPLYQHLQHSTGFQIDTTHVTFFGICPDCQDQASSAPVDA